MNTGTGTFNLKKQVFKNINYIIVGGILVVFLALYLAGLLSARSFITPNMLVQIAYTIILVVSLNLVVGFLGELSLGHAGFMYIGAYCGGLFSYYTQEIITSGLLRILISMLIGGSVAFIFGLIIGLPALRLRGDYLAIVTLAFGEIVRTVLKNITIKGPINNPAMGLSLDRYGHSLFIVAFCVALIALFCIQNLVFSKHGRAITAIRDNEIAARSIGINITNYKLIVFAIAAFFAGVAGVIFAHFSSVSPSSFTYNYSIEILVMVVLGGMGSITGSIVSSVFIVLLNTLLQAKMTGTLAGYKYLAYALILILVMMINSSPSFAPLKSRLNWQYVMDVLRSKKQQKKESKGENR